MTKIFCACLECKYHNNKTNVCKTKEINLSSNYVHTLYDGAKNFNTCKTFEESDEYKKIRQFIKEQGIIKKL